MQALIDKVNKFFKEKELPYEWNLTREGKVEVDVPDGDWKHDHLHLDWVMRENGYEQVGERQYGEPTGGDWYSSVHVFKIPVAKEA